MNHENVYDLLEDYVLGNIEFHKIEMIENHLDSGCAECLKRYNEISELSLKLAQDIPQVDPSHQVKENLLGKIKKSEQKQTIDIFRVFRDVKWVPAAAVILIVFLSTTSITLLKINSDLKKQLVETQDITSLLNLPGMQFVDLEGIDPNPQAFGKVVIDPEQGAAVVYMYALPQTPQGMEYQLWVMREGKPTSAGTFTVAGDGSARLALEELSDPTNIASFLVTIEPAGGENAPTGMMYLTGPNIYKSDN